MQQFLENAAAELETSSLNFCAAKKAAPKQHVIQNAEQTNQSAFCAYFKNQA